MKNFGLIVTLLSGLMVTSAAPASARPYRRPVARTAVRVARPGYRVARPPMYGRAYAPGRGYGSARRY